LKRKEVHSSKSFLKGKILILEIYEDNKKNEKNKNIKNKIIENKIIENNNIILIGSLRLIDKNIKIK